MFLLALPLIFSFISCPHLFLLSLPFSLPFSLSPPFSLSLFLFFSLSPFLSLSRSFLPPPPPPSSGVFHRVARARIPDPRGERRGSRAMVRSIAATGSFIINRRGGKGGKWREGREERGKGRGGASSSPFYSLFIIIIIIIIYFLLHIWHNQLLLSCCSAPFFPGR